MGKAVVLLSGPGASFKVVDAADVFSPGGLTGLWRVFISNVASEGSRQYVPFC